ncbi:MAG: hypothetical protein H0U76_25280 [Ktedonobacteraceae bacterium]|nr:hypothetical protein [Ktedonobacteraceae bacterium]
MQEPKQDEVTDTKDIEMVEIEQEDDELRQPRSPWFYVIWAAVILFIIGFAVFGVTTLMHIPPTIEKDTGFLPDVLAITVSLSPRGVVL